MALKIAVFQTDATPPLGSPLCGGSCVPAKKIVDRLSARGLVILEAGQPIVLCAVDWVSISKKSHDLWRKTLAQAAGTTPDRAAVHVTHPHDTPSADLGAWEILAEHGQKNITFDPEFEKDVLSRAAGAIRAAIINARAVTHLGMGKARVDKFASNRRIPGPDGNIEHIRWSDCNEEELRARAEGVIDPFVRLLCFWSGQDPLAVLTYYATHPQSFYNRGAVSADTVGLARGLREAAIPQALHIHFNGAGGNVAAGKYNDGSPLMRFKLAERLAAGMEMAWENALKIPLSAADISWKTKRILLPLNPSFPKEEKKLLIKLSDPKQRIRAAWDLSFLQRVKDGGYPVDLASLRVGPVVILHTPGELFVEYQLAAQAMRPDKMVCMAAYGDGGTGYIGTKQAYAQKGGYETNYSRVGPGVEDVLMRTFRELLA